MVVIPFHFDLFPFTWCLFPFAVALFPFIIYLIPFNYCLFSFTQLFPQKHPQTECVGANWFGFRYALVGFSCFPPKKTASAVFSVVPYLKCYPSVRMSWVCGSSSLAHCCTRWFGVWSIVRRFRCLQQ